MERQTTNERQLGAVGGRRPTAVAERLRRGKDMVDAATGSIGAPATPAAPSPDPFRQAGLPEVRRDELTVDHVASGLLHRGALVVRGLLPTERVQELRRFLDLGAMRIMPGSQGNVDQASMLDALVETHEYTGTLGLAESYVGERPVGMLLRTIVKRDERAGGLNWHQDAAFYRGKCGALNVWTRARFREGPSSRLDSCDLGAGENELRDGEHTSPNPFEMPQSLHRCCCVA